MLILEDLHCADLATLDLLVHLTRNLGGARLLIGTYRDVEVDRTHPLSGTLAELRRAGTFTRLSLRGLTPDEVHRMISGLQEEEILPSFATAVHRQTEGNPLFIQETVRYLVEEGLVTQPAGPRESRGSHPDETSSEMRIPEGLREVVGKRLSQLDAVANRLLSVAAVIGRNFSLATLQQVAGLEEEPLVAALEEAVRVGVLEEQTRPGQICYRFAHAFFRQTLYEELLAPRRLRLHQQIARALEDEYRARPEEHAAELAEHYAQSTERGDLEKAVAYCELAAGRAAAVYAYGEAACLLERALGVQAIVDPGDQRIRCRLLLALADVLCIAGEPQRATEEVAEEAFRLAEALGDSPSISAACRIALEAAFRYGSIGAFSRAARQHWAERADRHAPQGTPARVYADLALGRENEAADPSTDAEGRSRDRRALEVARALGDPRLIFECAALLLPGRVGGNWAAALRLAQEVAALPRQGISWWTTAIALSRCGNMFLACGQRDRAEDLWREVSELAQRTRDPTILAHATVFDIIVATLDGRLEAALQATERFRLLADQAGSSPRGLQQGAGWSMRALFYLGRAQEALDGLRQWRGGLGPPRLGLGLIQAGQRGEARSIFDEIIQPWRMSPPDAEAFTASVQPILELSVLLEDRAAAAFLLPLLAPVAPIVSTQLDLTCVARHLGAAAALLGDTEGARNYYWQALEVCQRVQVRPEIALIHLQFAELALGPALTPTLSKREREQGRAEALEHLDFAIEQFRAMGMQPALERALALQAGQRHAASRPPQPAYPGGLSRREVEVLRLLAAGRSNRDIADALVISLNTAAHHVSNIFGKIHATNRAEAASYATRHGLA